MTAEERQARNEAIFDLWLAGHTTRDIAGKLHMGFRQVAYIVEACSKAKLAEAAQTEKPPIYNVWNCSLCDPVLNR